MRSKSSMEVLEMEGYLGSMSPAELTRMWGWALKNCSAKSKRDLTWSGSETSARTATARAAVEVEPDEALISATTESASVELEV